MVLAFGLWAWVTYENDPETTRVLGGVSVSVEELGDTYEIVGDPPTVDVTVQGPQSVVTPLERESVLATVDMSEHQGTGEYEVEVDVDVPSGIRIRDVVPETVRVEIDQMTFRDDIPVSVLEPDDVPPNFQVREIDVEPNTVRVSGPTRSLDQIDRAEMPIEIAGRTTSFTDSYEPRLLDANGAEIAGVQVEPDEITVTVTLDVRGQVRKVVPVIVGDDSLAPGHELVRTTVLPTDEIVVDGPDEELAGIFFVTTTPVDVSGWDESRIVRDVELDRSRLPASVTLDEETVHVSIEIRRQVHQREISNLPISVMNPAPGTTVTLSEETGSVTLEGSRTAVESIEPEDITMFVNVGNADPGEYEFDLRVIVPAQVQYREVSPNFLEVVIEDELNNIGDDDNETAG